MELDSVELLRTASWDLSGVSAMSRLLFDKRHRATFIVHGLITAKWDTDVIVPSELRRTRCCNFSACEAPIREFIVTMLGV